MPAWPLHYEIAAKCCTQTPVSEKAINEMQQIRQNTCNKMNACTRNNISGFIIENTLCSAY